MIGSNDIWDELNQGDGFSENDEPLPIAETQEPLAEEMKPERPGTATQWNHVLYPPFGYKASSADGESQLFILKSGFVDTYIVVYEDAHEQYDFNILTRSQIFDLYHINF